MSRIGWARLSGVLYISCGILVDVKACIAVGLLASGIAFLVFAHEEAKP